MRIRPDRATPIASWVTLKVPLWFLRMGHTIACLLPGMSYYPPYALASSWKSIRYNVYLSVGEFR